MEIEELIQDPENAEMYYCPRRSTKNCLCLEEFVMRHIWMNVNLGTRENALKLLKGLRRKALELSKERCTENGIKNTNDDCWSNIQGFGNRKSKKYVQYIVKTRRKLRSHGICEIAAQKILKYSKKIIYRKLKHDYEHRNDLIADEMSKSNRNKNLIPIEALMEVRCCQNKCTSKLKNDVTFYSKLRSDAKTSQKRRREAIKKLLMTPSGETLNCYKFIDLFLGVSHTTISSVKKHVGFSKKRVKKRKSEQKYKIPQSSAENLKATMPGHTSNTKHQTTDAVNNFEMVNPILQDIGQSCVSIQNTEVPTTQTQPMSYPVNGFAEFNPNNYSLFKREKFQTTVSMNQNISSQGCPNVTNESYKFCVQSEGVASASDNLNHNSIGSTEQNFGNNVSTKCNNNLPRQQPININQTCPNMVNNFYYNHLPKHSANMNSIDRTNPSPPLYSNGTPVTTRTSSTFG
ncbi:hypothetical protein RF11_09385 [Thelohanellus kitauei]|uniref:Uncharacterized protein n=1 Tax=Thelohanellus kitauei TaxID=669202 RepID=A0A0C2I9V6_THEKT|nr:hypothetical protein RF11_09385 [Thelohanellus kitauei]